MSFVSSSTPSRQIVNELALIHELVPLQAQRIIELGCGNARLARGLLQQHPRCMVTGLEVDAIQHAKNLAAPADRLHFVAAGAQAIPFGDAGFDLAIMLKSLHHVPLDLMDAALAEIHRVLAPGGYWYVSEPVYAGPLNELMRLFNDEKEVRAAAQALLDKAAASGQWQRVQDVHFDVPVAYKDFADFEQRMLYPTFIDRRADDALVATLRELFAPHMTPEGARFVRPMHVTLLRKQG